MRDFALDLLLLGLWFMAVARLTRLLTKDEITDFIRVWVYQRHGMDSKLGYFTTCPWCVSIWVGSATAWYLIVLTEMYSWWWYPYLVLAGSYWAGISAVNLETDDEEIDVEIDNDPQ